MDGRGPQGRHRAAHPGRGVRGRRGRAAHPHAADRGRPVRRRPVGRPHGPALGASGCLALAFPLHPPGRPEKSRLDELLGAGVPTLVVQGERDPMGRPEEFPASVDLTVVPGADHGLAVAKRGPLSEAEAMAVVVESTLEWIVREVVGNR